MGKQSESERTVIGCISSFLYLSISGAYWVAILFGIFSLVSPVVFQGRILDLFPGLAEETTIRELLEHPDRFDDEWVRAKGKLVEGTNVPTMVGADEKIDYTGTRPLSSRGLKMSSRSGSSSVGAEINFYQINNLQFEAAGEFEASHFLDKDPRLYAVNIRSLQDHRILEPKTVNLFISYSVNIVGSLLCFGMALIIRKKVLNPMRLEMAGQGAHNNNEYVSDPGAESEGKHDGRDDPIRYFSCPRRDGLTGHAPCMATNEAIPNRFGSLSRPRFFDIAQTKSQN